MSDRPIIIGMKRSIMVHSQHKNRKLSHHRILRSQSSNIISSTPEGFTKYKSWSVGSQSHYFVLLRKYT